MHSQVGVILMIVFSGVIDYLLEHKSAGAGVYLGSSIYEYMAGTLWGGFEHPRTRASAVYQVVIAFIILIFISSCVLHPLAFAHLVALPSPSVACLMLLADTANLAAYMTEQSQARFAVTSFDDIQAKGVTMCTFETNPSLTQLHALYPMATYLVLERENILDELMSRNGLCSAAFLPMISYMRFRMEPKACEVRAMLVQPPPCCCGEDAATTTAC